MSKKAKAKILSGLAMAASIEAEVAVGVQQLAAGGRPIPGLAVVLVGSDPASQIYVRNKSVQTRRAGMRSFVHRLPASTTEGQLLELIGGMNADPQVNGILIQLPLPPHIDPLKVTNAIRSEKDVEGLGEVNVGRLALGMKEGVVPCTPKGCRYLLKSVCPDLRGRRVLIIGVSNLVGKPMAQLLLAENATVTLADRFTANLAAVCREADIVISATGQPELVRGDWLKAGAIVLDAGITRQFEKDGKARIVGDVAFGEALEKAAWVTPVPGGVGPMTVACLLQNTLMLAKGHITPK